jgi:hypothetical protein
MSALSPPSNKAAASSCCGPASSPDAPSCCGGGGPSPSAPSHPASAKLLAFAATSTAREEDVLTSLRTLQRILFNVVGDSDEPKFRRLRSTNPAIARLRAAPGAMDLLSAFGFGPDPADPDFLLLPPGPFDEAVAAVVTETLAALEDSIAAREVSARRAELEAGRKKREEAEAERQRLVALAKREQDERKGREADRGPAASKSGGVQFGAKAATWKDIGVDLAACGKGGG